MKSVSTLILVLLAAAAFADTRALVVAGLGGTPEYEADFQRHAQDAADALRRVARDVTLMLGETVRRERVQRELEILADRGSADDTLVVVLIGHGTFDERDYRFNVPGPDITGAELAAWLQEVSAPRQLVVAATSASGALQSRLSSEQRVVMTATRSGGERNASVFAGHFADALGDRAADTDKDGYVTAAEAFRFAESRVAEHYRQRSQMATEHPVLEGSDPAVALARLDTLPAFEPTTAAEQNRLAALESEIAVLRAEKSNREPEAYYAELQRLLLEMALLQRRLGEDREP